VTDDVRVSKARLRLVQAVQVTLRQTLGLLGVRLPTNVIATASRLGPRLGLAPRPALATEAATVAAATIGAGATACLLRWPGRSRRAESEPEPKP